MSKDIEDGMKLQRYTIHEDTVEQIKPTLRPIHKVDGNWDKIATFSKLT